jgi:hypothetical protein
MQKIDLTSFITSLLSLADPLFVKEVARDDTNKYTLG